MCPCESLSLGILAASTVESRVHSTLSTCVVAGVIVFGTSCPFECDTARAATACAHGATAQCTSRTRGVLARPAVGNRFTTRVYRWRLRDSPGRARNNVAGLSHKIREERHTGAPTRGALVRRRCRPSCARVDRRISADRARALSSCPMDRSRTFLIEGWPRGRGILLSRTRYRLPP